MSESPKKRRRLNEVSPKRPTMPSTLFVPGVSSSGGTSVPELTAIASVTKHQFADDEKAQTNTSSDSLAHDSMSLHSIDETLPSTPKLTSTLSSIAASSTLPLISSTSAIGTIATEPKAKSKSKSKSKSKRKRSKSLHCRICHVDFKAHENGDSVCVLEWIHIFGCPPQKLPKSKRKCRMCLKIKEDGDDFDSHICYKGPHLTEERQVFESSGLCLKDDFYTTFFVDECEHCMRVAGRS